MPSVVVGLTGPTGAGKSTWAKAFQALGCTVIDCDALARRVTELPAVQKALCAEFGADIMCNGQLDRRLLAARAFVDASSVKRLNAITHPAIRSQLQQQLDQAQADGARVVLIDAPLLFEGGIDGLCNVKAAVLAPPDVRRTRIMARDSITEAEAANRMRNQHDDSYFCARADVILDGTLTTAQIKDQTEQLLKAWTGGVP